jgi:microcystin-dependent protein
VSQHDLEIANQTFPATRTDLNNALQALGSLQSGATAPATTYANELWYDTANNILKLRNEDDDAWINLFEADQANDLIELISKVKAPDGSASLPVFTFANDLDTGIYRVGTNQIGISTGGTLRLLVDSDGDVTFLSGTPALKVKDINSTGSNQIGELQFVDSADAVGANVKYENSTLKLQIGGSSVAEFTATNNTVIPTGSMQMFAAAAAPTGWVLCDGSAINRTTYSALFAVIGTTFGAGNGTTTFNVPDMRGRAPIGVGTGSGLTARALAGEVGAETHALTEAQMPNHYHQMRGPNAITAPQNGGVGSGGVYGGGTPDDGAYGYGTWSVGNGAASGSLSTGTGNGSAHNNMQPSLAVNFIIKT